jgi:membrane protein YqaA with SNARE-associated domain
MTASHFYAPRQLGVGGHLIATEDILKFLWGILELYSNDPTIFLSVLFIYSILTAIILPIPVEAALLPLVFQPALLGTAAMTLGAGKAIGAGLIFLLGLKVEVTLRYWAARHRFVGKFVGYATRFVRATRWVGLFILLSIPFFPDTVPVYVYSIFNKQGQLISAKAFLLVNMLAGITRAILFVILSNLGFQYIVG